jgi:hypothetical protein
MSRPRRILDPDLFSNARRRSHRRGQPGDYMRIVLLTMVVVLGGFAPALADGQTPSTQPSPQQALPEDDPDLDLNTLQPDFTIVNLPTTLRMPRHKGAFRVTHRFGRPLGQGDFGDLASDLFGFDSGAQIGLEFRFGLMRSLDVAIVRTSDKTIEFFGQRNLLRQNAANPIGLGVVASIDGTDNFSEEFSPAVGFVLSRELEGIGAVYVEPTWVGNVNIFESFQTADDNTILLGLGGRVRIRPTLYVVGEFIPRLTGYDLGVNLGTFGIEKRLGGHSFQINFSNGIGTTVSQLARGGTGGEDWYIGFNISRKFF